MLSANLGIASQGRELVQTVREGLIYSSNLEFTPARLTEKMENRGDRKFKILSIDGGGIRGIIPLTILSYLELLIGPVADNFDLVAGTSTGGIIALALSSPYKHMRAAEILNIYQTRSAEIFKPNPYRAAHEVVAKMIPFLPFQEMVLRGLADRPIYTSEGVKALANEIFSESLMKDTKTNVFIPSVDISDTINPTPRFFNNRDSLDAFLSIQDVACATSAAPTYFPHKVIDQKTFIDGGLVYNNPSERAFMYSIRNNVDIEFQHVVSLGTGFADVEGIGPETGNHNLLYWAKTIFPTINSATTSNVDSTLSSILRDRYWRIDPGLYREIPLDDNTPETIRELSEAGQALLETETIADKIREIARTLNPQSI